MPLVEDNVVASHDEEVEDVLETMHVLIQLPKGMRVSSVYFDQLSDLDSAT